MAWDDLAAYHATRRQEDFFLSAVRDQPNISEDMLCDIGGKIALTLHCLVNSSLHAAMRLWPVVLPGMLDD